MLVFEEIKNPMKFYNQEAVEVEIKIPEMDEFIPTIITPGDKRFPELYDEILEGKYGEVTYQLSPTEEELLKQEKERLRYMRSIECYTIINRGQPWYDILTDEQKQDIKVWYEAWRDVTDTMKIPEMPQWLNDELNGGKA